MTSCKDPKMLDGNCQQHALCSSPCSTRAVPETTFDPEFSLPSEFFKIDFLKRYNIGNPHPKERMQLENDLVH